MKALLHKPELLFVFAASLFGLLSLVFMPILELPDENQHFQVSYSMLSANKAPGKDLIYTEGMLKEKIKDGTYWNLFTNKTSAARDQIAINTGSLVFDGKTPASIFDPMRIPQALGVVIGKIIYPSLGVMVLAGRIMVLLFFISAMYFVIKKVRHGKWAIFTLATLPMIIQQAASLSYDPINLVAIFAWVAFSINLITQKTPLTLRQLVIGILLLLFLFVSKANNLLLAALLFAVPAGVITKTTVYQKLRSLKAWPVIKYGSIVLFSIVAIAGIYIMQKKILAGHEFNPIVLGSILMNTFFWGDPTLINAVTIGTIGQFGSFYYSFPAWIVCISFIVIAFIFFGDRIPNVSKRFALISLGIFILSVLLIATAMYYGWAMKPERLGPGATVADGIQGRYFSPLFILLLPGISYLHKYFSLQLKKPLLIPVVALSLSTILFVFYIILTIRYFWW